MLQFDTGRGSFVCWTAKEDDDVVTEYRSFPDTVQVSNVLLGSSSCQSIPAKPPLTA